MEFRVNVLVIKAHSLLVMFVSTNPLLKNMDLNPLQRLRIIARVKAKQNQRPKWRKYLEEVRT